MQVVENTSTKKCKYKSARVENVVHLNICVEITIKLSVLVKQH